MTSIHFSLPGVMENIVSGHLWYMFLFDPAAERLVARERKSCRQSAAVKRPAELCLRLTILLAFSNTAESGVPELQQPWDDPSSYSPSPLCTQCCCRSGLLQSFGSFGMNSLSQACHLPHALNAAAKSELAVTLAAAFEPGLEAGLAPAPK